MKAISNGKKKLCLCPTGSSQIKVSWHIEYKPSSNKIYFFGFGEFVSWLCDINSAVLITTCTVCVENFSSFYSPVIMTSLWTIAILIIQWHPNTTQFLLMVLELEYVTTSSLCIKFFLAAALLKPKEEQIFNLFFVFPNVFLVSSLKILRWFLCT